MKTTTFLFILFLNILFLISCQHPSLKISEPNAEEALQIKSVGDQAALNLMKSLKSELKAAISEGGFQNAINVCKIKALSLTNFVKETQHNILKVKRISNKFRNPLNAPDSIEKLVLDHYSTLIREKKELPAFYIQKITENNQSRYCYYKPILMEQVCLGCHGQPENMDSTIVNQLANLYPEDKATGYSVGDFRGLISVTIRE
jgi:hypothetical protein